MRALPPGQWTVVRRAVVVSISLVSLIWLETGTASAVERAPAARPDGAAVELPLRMTGDHVVLQIHVGDDESPFRIVLDTGMPARGLVLYDSPRIDALDLSFDASRVNVSGAGGKGERMTARVAEGVRLRLKRPGDEVALAYRRGQDR